MRHNNQEFAQVNGFVIQIVISWEKNDKEGPMSYIKYTLLYTGDDGESYFKDVDVETPLPFLPLGYFSNPLEVKQLLFRHSLPSDNDWYSPPQKSFIIYISGKVSVEASSGEVRHFSPGDTLYVADVGSKGHKAIIHDEGVAIVITTP
jgi:hypothetical protein